MGATVVDTTDGFTVTLAELAAGASYRFNVSYTVPACELACEACNFVTISSPYEDPVETNNQARDCNELRTEANLNVCKSDGVTTVTAGDGITYEYTIQVANNGPSCAQKVKLVDHFPAAVTQLPGSIVTTSGTCINVNGSDFSCNLLTLNPGSTVEVRVKYTVPADANTCSVTNVATVSSLTFDPELCDNDAFEIKVKNTMKSEFVLESMTLKSGKRILDATRVSDLVKETTCGVAHGAALREGWSATCRVVLKEQVSDLRVSVRGVQQVQAGFHPIMASALASPKK